MSKHSPLLLAFILSFAGCSDSTDTAFTKLSKRRTGIDFRNLLQESPELNVLNYLYFYNGAGVAVGDINNDGLPDLCFAGNMVKNRLYLNKGNFEFDDITKKSGIADKQGWCTGVTMADVNADGWLDIYICRSADLRPEKRRNLLFINNKDLTFSEMGAQFGLDDPGYSTHSAFFDMDRDGDLDLFLLNHSLSEYTGVKLEMADLKKKKDANFGSKLFRNDGGKFTDVSGQAGILNNVLSFGLGCGISDANGDNWPDIYVCNDFNEQDYLYINNQDGSFSDRLPDFMDHISLFSMGCDWTDLNNDGLPDLATVDMLPEDNFTQKMHMGAENYNKFQHLFSNGFYFQYSRNMLHLNSGNGSFAEIGQLAGTSNTDWSWAVLGADFDNDGWKDLFVSNGYVKDYTEMDFLRYTADQTKAGKKVENGAQAMEWLEKMTGSKLANYLFHNQAKPGIPTFRNEAKNWGLGDETWAYGAAFADLDLDGDLDIVTNNINQEAGIYKNNFSEKNQYNWLKINLLQKNANASAIGSKVSVFTEGQQFFQEMMPSRGYASSVDFTLHFGLGDAKKVDSIVVIWPDGSRQKTGPTEVRKSISIEKNQDLPQAKMPAPASPFFQKNTAATAFRHMENPEATDFKTQVLLPRFFSRQGPCLAKADVNADGLDDIFAGGAKGQPAAILLARPDGVFLEKSTPVFSTDKNSEDVGATFFDADGDGDPDLYVVSGGYEFEANDPALQDRLYLNDGRGNFSKNAAALPAETSSGSCARAADVDKDGDLDLFVGGRLVPGRWPELPVSQLLMNDGKGNFSKNEAQFPADLARMGMVTDAAWADLNGDGFPELIAVGEWMGLRCFDNKNGRLEPNPDRSSPEKTSGWWNCLTAKDLDGDGDTDLVAGNLGLNSQVRASEKEPATLHFADYDQNGSVDPILGYFVGGKSWPAAFRDDLGDQLPMLKKQFLDYKTYANASLTDFFSPEILGRSQVLSATNLQTCVFWNENGHFSAQPLPTEAQVAPVHSILAEDVNLDGKVDLIVAGNDRHVRIKFGRYDANHGQVFIGDGKGNFTYLPDNQSGMRIRGDVRSAVFLQKKGSRSVVFGLNDAGLEVYDLR